MAANNLISSKVLLLKWIVVFYALLVLLLLVAVGPINEKVLWTCLFWSPLFVAFLFIYFRFFEFIYIDDTSLYKGRRKRRVLISDIDALMYYGIRNRGFFDVAILFHGDRVTTVSLMFISDKEAFFKKFPWAKFHEATKGVLQKKPAPV